MGDKGKGKESGNGKKAKTPKVGNRPHEERMRQDAIPGKPATADPVKH
jgi:hypothetical protein